MPASNKSSKPRKTRVQDENYMITLAVRQAEKQLSDGTAPPSVVCHYLKLGSTREQLEKERLRLEGEMLKAKADALSSAANSEALVAEAIEAFKSYAGNGLSDDLEA